MRPTEPSGRDRKQGSTTSREWARGRPSPQKGGTHPHVDMHLTHTASSLEVKRFGWRGHLSPRAAALSGQHPGQEHQDWCGAGPGEQKGSCAQMEVQQSPPLPQAPIFVALVTGPQ